GMQLDGMVVATHADVCATSTFSPCWRVCPFSALQTNTAWFLPTYSAALPEMRVLASVSSGWRIPARCKTNKRAFSVRVVRLELHCLARISSVVPAVCVDQFVHRLPGMHHPLHGNLLRECLEFSEFPLPLPAVVHQQLELHVL
ncbi:hypothetical protein T310_9783, partial [Rasamsonia emersonii CBS 393.64]